MSQEVSFIRVDGPSAAAGRAPPRAAAGDSGGRRRPRDDLLFSARRLPRAVAGGVPRRAGRPVLRAVRSTCCCGKSGGSSPTSTSTHRTMHFGPVQIPAAGLGWLGVAPEHRQQGLGTHLLRAAESQMADRRRAGGNAADRHPPLLPPHRLGTVRPGELPPRRRPGAVGPASGPRSDSPPPPPVAHPAVAPMGTGGAEADLRPERRSLPTPPAPTARWNAPMPIGIGC